MAAEVVKIKVAQQIELKNEVKAHTFVFHEGLNQLKSDMGKIWFFGYDETEVTLTDLKEFIEFKQYYSRISQKLHTNILKQVGTRFPKELFSVTYQMTPEQQSQLEEYTNSSDDFKMTLQALANQLNQSGKTHIILIDEVDLRNVTSKDESIERNNLELDLSYISEYENVHFIFCLRPAKVGLNYFSVTFPTLQSNQHFACLGTSYRNTEAVQKLIKNFQSQIDAKSEGYSMMGDIPMIEMLPPPLVPSGYNSSVIWVPTIPPIEDKAINNICKILKDLGQHQSERNPFIVILHNKKKSKTLAKKLTQKNLNWNGPHEDTNYNGSEADIIVYICDENMNIQTLARARRLLIILTCDTECNPKTILMLQKAVSENMADMVCSGPYPAEITKCNSCGTFYNHVENDQCPGHVICPKFAEGCLWKGHPEFQKTHIENCEYFADIRIDSSKLSRYFSFCSNHVKELIKVLVSIIKNPCCCLGFIFVIFPLIYYITGFNYILYYTELLIIFVIFCLLFLWLFYKCIKTV